MQLIFDIETTGLPKYNINNKKKEFPQPDDLDSYNSARIVSIAWVLINSNKDIIQQEYYIIKPDNFIIPDNVVKIHGINTEYANIYGIDIEEMFKRLEYVLNKTNCILSYNIKFDYNILKSELIRYNKIDIINKLGNNNSKCIMLMSQNYMSSKYYPKLCDAYKYVFNKEMNNAHNAMDDTLNCYKIYKHLG
jgi:DNA polymerase-3 subunit alpha